LELICKEFTSNEIAKKLDVSKETVSSHRARLMRKTGAKNLIGLYKWTQEYYPAYLD
jgi:DNA-binding CsgD family transcriptional regulator